MNTSALPGQFVYVTDDGEQLEDLSGPRQEGWPPIWLTPHKILPMREVSIHYEGFQEASYTTKVFRRRRRL